MSGNLKYFAFNTDMGWVGVLASARGLLGTTLPQPSAQEACRQLGDDADCAVRSSRPFTEPVERLRLYFCGRKMTFPTKLDLSRATPFQREVWATTRLIPYGETRSYAWVAGRIGRPRAARAVGQALGENPLPVVIPCHRVVAGNGSPGGFSGGIEMKKRLLSLEAAAGIG